MLNNHRIKAIPTDKEKQTNPPTRPKKEKFPEMVEDARVEFRSTAKGNLTELKLPKVSNKQRIEACARMISGRDKTESMNVRNTHVGINNGIIVSTDPIFFAIKSL
jgi:hypothetical protein